MPDITLNTIKYSEPPNILFLTKLNQNVVQKSDSQLKSALKNKPAKINPPSSFKFTFPEEVTTSIMFPPAREESEVKKGGKFFAEVRRRGQFIRIGKPTELKTAFKLGRESVGKTLAASFRIREAKTGKVVPIFPVGKELRTAKKEAGVIVQRRGFRLASYGERGEIKQAKFLSMYRK